MAEITLLLQRSGSDPAAREQLIRLVYDHLHKVARARLAEWGSPGMQATELINQAYLRLFPQNGATDWKSQAQFFGYASRAMSQLLHDLHRHRHAQRRGAGVAHQPLLDGDAAVAWLGEEEIDILDLLQALAVEHPLSARVAELRYLCGWDKQQIKEILEASQPSVVLTQKDIDKHWRLARAWLRSRLVEEDNHGR